MDNWALVKGFLMLGDTYRKGYEEKVMCNRDQMSAESRILAERGARGGQTHKGMDVPARRHINETESTRQLTRRDGSGLDRGLGKII